MGTPLFSPCDLCGGRDYPPNVKRVSYEGDSRDWPELLHVCARCEKLNFEAGCIWANPCAVCGLRCCTQEEYVRVYEGTTTPQGPDPDDYEFRCSSCKPKEVEP